MQERRWEPGSAMTLWDRPSTIAVRITAYVVGAALVFDSFQLAAQPIDGPAGSIGGFPVDLAKWAMTQGGLVVVTLVILWSYRRDFKKVIEAQQQELGVVTELAKECSAHIAQSAAAQREASQVQREFTAAFMRGGK